MKTYNQTVQKPRLVIEYDHFATSPREDTNVGKFITNERNYESPDKDEYLNNIMLESYDGTTIQNHMSNMQKALSEKCLAIFPITRYEHGAVKYYIGTGAGFDHSMCGFYFITKESWKECMGEEVFNEERAEEVVNSELESYNKYANGEVYMVTLYDEEGEVQDQCSGFYDLESIKAGLPSGEGWEDENMEDYLKN